MENCVYGDHIGIGDTYLVHNPSGLKMCLNCALKHREFSVDDEDINDWVISRAPYIERESLSAYIE